jgi:MYXO-CTERM domain-containing protein
MLRRVASASTLVVGLVLVGAIPAWAHVTVEPSSAPKGGSDIEIGFRVPNEEAKANTTKVAIELPSAPPILNVLAQSVPGWTAAVVTTTLPKPIQTDDGPVSDIVTQVAWTANNAAAGIKPGDFEKFEILVGTLPDTGDQIVFKALQTYSNGDVVSWIDPVTPGGPAADHPTPILSLTSPTAGAPTKGSESATGAPAVTTGLAKKSQVDSARTIGIIGIVVGALGLLAAGAALASRRRSA